MNANTFIRAKMKGSTNSLATLQPLDSQNGSFKVELSSAEQISNTQWKIFPYKGKYKFSCGMDKSNIDIKPLTNYLSHEHHLNIFPEGSSSPAKYAMIIDFVRFRNDSRGNSIKIRLKNAHLDRDTEMFGKMAPYIKIMNKTMKFQGKTKTSKKGDKDPIFNEEIQIPFKSLEDEIKIQVWDDDLFKDDYIAQNVSRAFQFFNGLHKEIRMNLSYTDKKQIHNGGYLILELLEFPEMITH